MACWAGRRVWHPVSVLCRQATTGDLGQIGDLVARSWFGEETAGQFRSGLATGSFRPAWIWLATDGGRCLVCALWWGSASGEHPLALDCLAAAPTDGTEAGPPGADLATLAGSLLDAAHQQFRSGGMRSLPAYHLMLPPRWQEDATTRAQASWRRAAAAHAGLRSELERLRFEWTPDAGLPVRSARLRLRPEPDDEVFIEAFRRVAEGSLDATTAAGVLAKGADRQARDELAIYRGMPGDRSWWRLAYTPDGRLAGLAIPSRNDKGPVVGYLGVVPELRGHGYAGDLLAEITGFLAGQGAERIRADTDVGNRPMAAAFERAGYRNFAIRLVLFAPERADAR